MRFALIIPAYQEPELYLTLQSLQQALAPAHRWHIWLILNGSISEKPVLERFYQAQQVELLAWYHALKHPNFALNIREVYFPEKLAGVGSARKYGMDLAAAHLDPHEWIVNLDADCLVSSEYFQHIEQLVRQNKNARLLNLGYSHENYIKTRNINDETLISGILAYEKHLKYYEKLLQWCGHPFACQTVGSAFAVRGDVYKKSGGMNTRKAGEDFYFIQKVVKYFPFYNDYQPIVYPSCRVSNRVPFGTGKAQMEFLKQKIQYTYHPAAAIPLRDFFRSACEILTKPLEMNHVQNFTKEASLVLQFLGTETLQTQLKLMYNHASNTDQRIRRFFQWFDLFMCMKYFHFAEVHGFSKVNVSHLDSVIPLEMICILSKV